MAIHTGSRQQCPAFYRFVVTGHTCQILVGAIKPETGLPVMVKLPVLPSFGVMAKFTLCSQISLVFIIASMARITVCCCIPETLALVTFFALHLLMLSQ